MIFGKGSKIYSIINCKCPKCHEGRMFPANTLYHPAKFNKMNPNCEVCGESFEPEPGFYFGSMFVSYGVNTAFFVAVWLLSSFIITDLTITQIIGILFVVVVGLLPITFRLSRSIWINCFVHYDPKMVKEVG